MTGTTPRHRAEIVLVHGMAHGAWCWELLEPELASRGHRTVAMDLPVDVVAAGLDDYADAVVTAMAAAEVADDAVLVGHSLGGMVVPRVALRRRVGRIVFLCSMLVTNQNQRELLPKPELDGDGRRLDGRGRLVFTREEAIRSLFADCPRHIADWAVSRMRPQSLTPLTGDSLVLSRRPEAGLDAIFCTEDEVVPPALVERAGEWLGKRPHLLPGGHSPFLSRPAVLAGLLSEIATREE